MHNCIGKSQFYFREIIAILTDYILHRGLFDPMNVSVFTLDAPLRYIFGSTVMHKSDLVLQVNRHLYAQDRATVRTTRIKYSCGFSAFLKTKFHLQPAVYDLLKPYETLPPDDDDDETRDKPPPPIYRITPHGVGEGTEFGHLIELLLRYLQGQDLYLDLTQPDIAILFGDPLASCIQIQAFAKYQTAAILARCVVPGTLRQMSGLAVVRNLCGQGPYWPRKVNLSELHIPRELKAFLVSLGAQQRKEDDISNSRCVSPLAEGIDHNNEV